MAKISRVDVGKISSSKFGGSANKAVIAKLAYGGKTASSINKGLKATGIEEGKRQRYLSVLEPNPKKKLK
ncbi:MAG: hypothetical protein Q7T79_00790 [bacterium]|nr:hypothetical protein [bacterium]